MDFILGVAAVAGGAVLLGPAALALVGFGSSGVAVGSIAAGVQAGIGNVAAGSAFAALQSIGAAGVATSTVATAAGAAGAGAALVQALN